MATIGERLRELRLSKRPKISQAELGRRLGVADTDQSAQNWVSRRERGAGVTVEEAIAIAEGLGAHAALVIAEGADLAPLVDVLKDAKAQHVGLAVRLLQVLPQLRADDQDWLREIIEAGERRAAARARASAS